MRWGREGRQTHEINFDLKTRTLAVTPVVSLKERESGEEKERKIEGEVVVERVEEGKQGWGNEKRKTKRTRDRNAS